MKAGDWDRIERICHEAGALDPAERRAFLDRVCADDPDVRREVESLLGFQRSAEPFLERSALQETAALIDPADVLPAPQIPGYTILELIGEGGMGVVYLAEQDAPLQRRVALKLIKPGMDSRRVVERFESERQALARMDHPNIAMVFDAGTTDDGRPFFVMEFVPGVPITEYCDRHRLSTRDRLELFLNVCAAVQHAHQKGVIHRDLKPSNVLVSSEEGDARPKVIDFGIAKAVQQPVAVHGGVTEHGTLVGTPEYMSPEQAAFSPDIDTTSDVYTLGVLLYELLVGTLPFDSNVMRAAGPDEWRRVIRETDPPRPSTRLTGAGAGSSAIAAARKTDPGRLSRDLRGDLDWIVLKALERDRRRRYATAAALAADVERYLASQPVEARPPSAVYRLQKFTRRYRGAVAAAAVILLVFLAGFGTTLVQFVRAERARAEAEREREQAKRERAQADVHRQAAEVATREATVRRRDAERATDEANRAQMAATREAEAAEAARREAEFRTYVATIAAADGDLRSNRPREARQRLLAVPPGQRGWEWDHLLLQSDPSLATLESGAPCESWLSGGARLLRTFAHGPRIPPNMNRAIWSGAHALTVLNGGAEIALRHCTRIDAWIGGAGTPLTYEAAELILAAGPAGDVLTLVPRAVERVRLELIRGEISELMIRSGPWELHRFATGSRVAIGTLGPFEQQPACAAISPDGRLIAVGFVPRFNEKGWPEDDIFEVWDARASRRLARMVPTKPPEDTRTAPACHVLFSPDSTRLASSGATVHVWDASSWAVVVADPAQAGKVSQPIAFSPDGMRMAIGRLTGLVDVLHLDGSQRLDHLEANGLIAALPPPVADRIALVAARRRNEVKAIGFSPDGTRVVTGADVNVGVWDLARGVLTAFRSGHSLDVVGVAVAPDGRIVSADTTGTVKVWPADATGAVTVRRGRFSIDQDRLEVSRDGSIAVVPQTDGGLLGWRLADMSEIVFRPGTGKRDPSAVTSLALTRDGRHVLIGENDQVGTVQTLEVPSGRSVRSAPAHARLEADCTPGRAPARNGVFEMAVSPDGRALGTIDGDCLVVRDPETMRVLAVLRELPVRFAFRPDGRLVVATRSYQSRRARFLIWEWQTDRIRAAVPAPAPLIWRIAMSADGQRVAFSGRDLLHPAIVSVWDGDLTREHGRLPVPANTSFAALSADGSRIATSTLDDSAIDIWDVDRLQLLHVLSDDEAQSGGLGLAFTPDGRLIAARRSGGVTIWQTRRAR